MQRKGIISLFDAPGLEYPHQQLFILHYLLDLRIFLQLALWAVLWLLLSCLDRLLLGTLFLFGATLLFGVLKGLLVGLVLVLGLLVLVKEHFGLVVGRAMI